MSMALAYIDSVRHRLNLTIRANVQAHRVMLEGNRAVGVEVESGGETFVVEGGQIVLCAGAVASPHLLMLSGIGPADQLGAQGIPVAAGTTWCRPEYARSSQRVCALPGQGRRAPGPQRNARPAAALHRHRLRHAQRYDSFPRVAEHSGPGRQPCPHGELRPLSRGGQGRAAAGVRRPRPCSPAWTTATWKRAGTASGCGRPSESVSALLRHSAYDGDHRRDNHAPTPADLETDEALDDWLRRNISTSYHISGTCKMGTAVRP